MEQCDRGGQEGAREEEGKVFPSGKASAIYREA